MTYNFTLVKESDEDRENYYNKAAAHERQKQVDADVEKFLANGGHIQKIPYGVRSE